MSTRGDRGRSGEEYVVIINGDESDVLPRGRAMDRGQYNGEMLAHSVEVRRLRPGRATVLVAAWKNGVKTK